MSEQLSPAPIVGERSLWVLTALLLALFFIQSAVSLESESMTFDEPTAIATAFAAFRSHDLAVVRERPPLLGLALAVPLRLFAHDPRLPPSPDPADPAGDVKFSLSFFHDQGNDPILILRVSRYCALALSLFLAAALVVWSRDLGGMPAAVLAAALFALCPNLLAHSHLATNDMPSTIFVFIALWALERFWSAPSNRAAAWAGLCLGLALTAKLSGVIILPLYAAVAGSLWHGGGTSDERKRRLLEFAVLGAAAFVTIGAVMGGKFDYAAFFAGFGKIYSVNRPDYLFYMAGRLSHKPWWYYYFYAAAIKTPLPLLGLAGLGCYVMSKDPAHRRSALLAGGAVALFVTASCFDKVNLGLRRILQIYPFLILLASQAVRLRLSPAVKYSGLAGLLALQAVSVSRAAPHYLTYFNEIAGGPAGGIYCLDDCNIDWGQGLPSLRDWLKGHPGLPVRLAYYGTARPKDYGVELPRILDSEICSPNPVIYAMSAHLLVYILKTKGQECSWLGRYTPMERLGNSIYLYDFRPEASAAR
ncbi:MAG: glycosyltransferase family 39 protein [Elusimicrobia bacterium]|nr:glycosyltransferase family 39 protein [Elusimicrobiota bacterium]